MLRGGAIALFVGAGYELREAIEFGNWKLVFMATCLFAIGLLAEEKRWRKAK